MFCPECETEYRTGFTVCSDCGRKLVDRLPDKLQKVERQARNPSGMDIGWPRVTLRAMRKGFFSADFVVTEDEHTVAEIEVRRTHGTCVLAIEGTQFLVHPLLGRMVPIFIVSTGDSEIASVEAEVIEYAGLQYTLCAEAANQVLLLDRSATVVGTLSAEGGGVTMDSVDSLPTLVKVFAIWIYLRKVEERGP